MHELILLAATNLFIVLYLLHAWSWDLPAESNLKQAMKFARTPVIWLGIWHSWKMFAPRPILVNSLFHVELKLPGGEIVEVHDVDLSQKNCFAAFLDMREAKYQENLRNKVFKVHREAYCKYMIKNHCDAPDQVVRATLVQIKQRIRKFGTIEEHPTERVELFTHHV